MAGQEGPLRVVVRAHENALDLVSAWAACGVYRLQFPDGSFYIGSTVNMRRRIRGHARMLIEGTHANLKLQRNWAKYGAFEVWPLVFCRKTESVFFEQLLMDGFEPTLNIRMVAHRREWTEASRQKVSKTHSGKVVSKETCERISQSKKGRGLGNRNRRGKPSSQTELDRLSNYMMGNTYRAGTVLTEGHKGKISASLVGNKNTLGRRQTPEEKARRSEGMKRAWAERRANAG